MFERLFPVFRTEKCWKILVECVSEVGKPKLRDLLGVFTVQVEAQVEDFLRLDHEGKKGWALDALTRGLDAVLAQTGWDCGPFQATIEEVRLNRLANYWQWRNAVKSPGKGHSAAVFCSHQVDRCDIILVVYRSDGTETHRTCLVSTAPDEFDYAHLLGCLGWESDSVVFLENKEKDKKWHLDLRDSAKLGT